MKLLKNQFQKALVDISFRKILFMEHVLIVLLEINAVLGKIGIANRQMQSALVMLIVKNLEIVALTMMIRVVICLPMGLQHAVVMQQGAQMVIHTIIQWI